MSDETRVESKIRDRIAQLRREYEAGTQRLADLDAESKAVRETMLRISGAVQVLEEMLDGTDDGAGRADTLPGNGAGISIGASEDASP